MSTPMAGFTLLDVLITITIAAILIGAGVPAFQTTLQNSRTTSQTNEFVTSLNLARSTAVTRRRTINICVGDSQSYCSGTDWASGWVILDNTTNPPEVIRTFPGLKGGTTLSEANSASNVAFTSFGRANSQANFTLTPGSCNDNGLRTIAIGPTGRVGVAHTACP